jgi:carboxymethylenebutenolidase
MGHNVDLTASDSHHLGAYLAEPAKAPRGGIVVVQEIFGVTRHIRDVVDQYAAAGYLAIAPALFDRVEPNVDVAYTDMQRAMGYAKAMDADKVMLDLEAAIARVGATGKIGVVGYCWGGTMAYLASARLDVDAAVAYYGGGINNHLEEKPRAPVMFHFGEKDAHIPLAAIEETRAAYPNGIYHLYPAGHGFNCTDRASYDPACSKLAFERSLEFFHKHVG